LWYLLFKRDTDRRLVAEEMTTFTTRIDRSTKMIDVIRHAEALHNPFVSAGKKTNDESLLKQGRSMLNPQLSERGLAQASELRAQLLNADVKYDLVITTPLEGSPRVGTRYSIDRR